MIVLTGPSKGKYRKTKFNIEGDDSFIGWTDGTMCSGWDCPKFEKEVADEIMRIYNLEYDEEIDAYIERIYSGSILESVDEYKGHFINTRNGQIKVYEIGKEWIWEEE